MSGRLVKSTPGKLPNSEISTDLRAAPPVCPPGAVGVTSNEATLSAAVRDWVGGIADGLGQALQRRPVDAGCGG